MNAIELLKADHKKVNGLFGKVKATEESEHLELFKQIKAELDVHTHIEETIFYPKIREEPELEDIILEGLEEHHQANMFLRELSELKADDEKFEPKLEVLIEDVVHHFQEEEGKMFPQIEELFDEEILRELGEEMEEEKESFQKTMKASA